MQTIELHAVLPEVFSGRNGIVSDIWHREVSFKKDNVYLVEAASGTGKSSLCSFLYGYRSDYQGMICFDGENIKNLNVKQWVELRRKHLSILFQELRLFPELTALENVKLKNGLTGYCKEKAIKAWFERLGIADKTNQKVGLMSWGQQQRVAFVRALCQPFDFILLDEPISHLDDGNGRIMAEILNEELTQRGSTAILTSIGKHIEMKYTQIMSL